MIFFSIIIITRNRADTITRTLDTVKKLEYYEDKLEIVVVDNGSTDNTRVVVEQELKNSGINFKIVVEEVKGICRARNKGVEVASGEWLLFLDDDVFVSADLLKVYLQAQSIYPDAAAFGGPARLDPEIPRPWWWIPDFEKSMSCQNYGDEYREYPKWTNPYGLNMLIRRNKLRELNGFDERLDKLTNSFADETEYFLRLAGIGGQLIYVPDAEVIHSVMPDRLNWKNFMNRYTLVGKSHACLDCMHNTYFFRPLSRRMASSLIHFIKSGSPAVFFTEIYAWNGYRKFIASNAGFHI